MLPSHFDYIFVHLRQKACLRPKLSLKFLSTLGPNPTFVNFRPEPEKPGPTFNSASATRNDNVELIVKKNISQWRSFCVLEVTFYGIIWFQDKNRLICTKKAAIGKCLEVANCDNYVYGPNPELDKIPNWTKSRTDKILNRTKSRMDKIPNWTKSRIGKFPNWTKSRTDKIQNWTKSRMDKIPNRTKSQIGQNHEWAKSRMGKISNGRNPEWTKHRMENPERSKSRI